VQNLLDHFHIEVTDIPVVICRAETVLRNPTNSEIASCLGFNEAVDQTQIHDVVLGHTCAKPPSTNNSVPVM
jgi:thioredoxin reductase (NADPH)